MVTRRDFFWNLVYKLSSTGLFSDKTYEKACAWHYDYYVIRAGGKSEEELREYRRQFMEMLGKE